MPTDSVESLWATAQMPSIARPKLAAKYCSPRLEASSDLFV